MAEAISPARSTFTTNLRSQTQLQHLEFASS